MLRQHGMGHGAHVHSDLAVCHSGNGNVLFAAGFHRIGDQLLHLLAAAGQCSTGILNHTYQIAAAAADFKFHEEYLLS